MALELSGQHVLDGCILEREIGIHALELLALGLELLDPLELVERSLRRTCCATDRASPG
jgi:hypothetical protein